MQIATCRSHRRTTVALSGTTKSGIVCLVFDTHTYKAQSRAKSA